jgi:hypothetical protein
MEHSLSSQLKGYSLLFASMLCKFSSEAQVVYTDIDPDRELGCFIPTDFPYSDSYDLDLNNDGVVDFKFNFYIQGFNQIFSTGTFPEWISYNFYEIVLGQLPGNIVMSTGGGCDYLNFGLVEKFGAGENIGYQPDNGQFAEFAGVYHYYNCGQSSGEFYVGLSLEDNGVPHYGWVRVKLANVPNGEPDTLCLVIKDYAYNKTPNEGIIAGDTLGVSTSVSEASNAGIEVFPTQIADVVTVKCNSHIKQIKVIDLNGKIVKSIPGNGQMSMVIEVSELPNSVYLIHVVSNERYFTSTFSKY